MTLAYKILDFVLPPRCVVTGDIVDRQGMLSARAWADVNFISDPQCARCGFPFDFDLDGVSEGNLCPACVKNPPVYNLARAAVIYDDASRDIVLGFKHGDQTHAVPTFIPWLERAGEGFLSHADYLVPVPLHSFRLLRRRFNQAGILAQYLSKQVHTPVLVDGLKRTRSTPTQGHLNEKERQKNVKKAFAVNPKYQLENKKIVLIDDVFTTGATVTECTKILLAAGVSEVNILTLSRVVKPIRF